MKISKLFHWLYAILMLLPAFAIGVTCAYAIFNKNAYKSFDYEQKSNLTQITNLELVKENLQYTFVYEDNVATSNVSTTGRIRYSEISIDWNDYTNVVGNWNGFEITYNLQNSNTYIYLFRENEDSWGTYLTNQWQNIKQITFTALESVTTSRNLPTKVVVGYQYSTINVNSISSVFYYSIDKVQQSPLFNWAYDSFLATPITYITGLFGMASDHIAVMLMSYWLAISVIWLVFDMVMYVPLLVHRWIDKGVLE